MPAAPAACMFPQPPSARFAPGTSQTRRVPRVEFPQVLAYPIPGSFAEPASNAVFVFSIKRTFPRSGFSPPVKRIRTVRSSAKSFLMTLVCPIRISLLPQSASPVENIARGVLALRQFGPAGRAEEALLLFPALRSADAALRADSLAEHLHQFDRAFPAFLIQPVFHKSPLPHAERGVDLLVDSGL